MIIDRYMLIYVYSQCNVRQGKLIFFKAQLCYSVSLQLPLL